MPKTFVRQFSLVLMTMLAVVLPISGGAIQAQEEIQALPEPTNFYIDLIEGNDVILLWDEIRDQNLEGFIVLRAEKVDVAPAEIARVGANESSYTDSDIQLGKTYTYQVKSYGGNLLTGDSEIKSVVIQKEQQFSSPFNKASDEGSSDSSVDAASNFISTDGDNFWQLFLAVNTIAFGLLLFVYMIIRYFLVDRAKEKYKELLNTKLVRKARMKLQLKSDHEHPDIVEDAKDEYYGKKKSKLKEWMDSSKDPESGGEYTLPRRDTTQN